MTTKDYNLSLKGNFVGGTSNNQYSNLNLNQTINQSINTVHSKSAPINNRKVSKNDLTDSNDSQRRKNSHLWNKFDKNSSLNYSNVFGDSDKRELKERKKLSSSKDVNKSTLSLHISVYENSVEAVPSDHSFGDENDEILKNSKQIVKTRKQLLINSSLTIQNPFEFPRQQENEERVTEPEVSQFTASQQLLNPNESITTNNENADSLPIDVIQQFQGNQIQSETDNGHSENVDQALPVSVPINDEQQVQDNPLPQIQPSTDNGNLPQNMADIIVHEIEHKNVKIVCKTGSIARSIADVALVSSTPQYTMDVGAARALASAGGQRFHEQRLAAIDEARENDESYITIDTDDILTLPFHSVIVIPVRGRNRSSMRVIYRQALKAAIDSEYSSVVMPLLGCGGLNIHVSQATQELLEAILTFSFFGNLTTINFIDINIQSMERLGQLLDTIPNILPDPGPSYGVHPAPAFIPDLPSQSAALSDVTIISEHIRAVPPTLPPRDCEIVGTSAAVVNEEDNKVKEEHPFTEIPRTEVGNHHLELNSTQSFPCSICLCDLVASAGNGEEDSESLANDPVVRMKMCTHEYHKSCIETCFQTKKRCPLCMRWYAPSFGNQPMNSVMRVKRMAGRSPDSHPTADGWFKIRYIVPGGIQTANHPRPGVPYSGTTRIAYIPNDEGGRHVLNLLRKAFEHRHIFTIGDSITTGAHNVPVWVIHHKTEMTGGPPNYGFPDPGYYERVIEELSTVGITKESLNS